MTLKTNLAKPNIRNICSIFHTISRLDESIAMLCSDTPVDFISFDFHLMDEHIESMDRRYSPFINYINPKLHAMSNNFKFH